MQKSRKWQGIFYLKGLDRCPLVEKSWWEQVEEIQTTTSIGYF